MSTELVTQITNTTKGLDKPPLLSRNSQLNLRPQEEIINNNRIRSRSVSRATTTSSSSGVPSTSTNPLNLNLDILPTIISSPSLPVTSFENLRSGVVNTKEQELEIGSSNKGTNNYSPVTSVDVVVKDDSGKLSLKGFTSSRKERERGKSFTTLLVRGSPVVEKEDPLISADSTSSLDQLPLVPIQSLKNFIPQLLILLTLFLSSFLLIAILITTLPGLFIPHSINELPALTSSLSEYQSSSFLAQLHLFSILSLLYCWKQTFSIPGSLLSNVLFGALYGVPLGSLMACVWTAVGSTGSYYISIIIAPLIEYYFAKPLLVTRRALNLPSPSPASNLSTTPATPISTSDIFSHLLLARFFPLLPYSVLNLICGVLHLPIGIFFSTLVIGSFPFNFVTVSIGSVIASASQSTATSIDGIMNPNSIPMKIWSKEVLIKLILVTLISLLPLLFRKKIQTFISSQTMIDLLNYFSRTWFGFNEFLSRKMLGLGILRFSFGTSNSNGRNGNGIGGMSASDRRRKNRSWIGDSIYSMSRSGSRESSEGGDGSILG